MVIKFSKKVIDDINKIEGKKIDKVMYIDTDDGELFIMIFTDDTFIALDSYRVPVVGEELEECGMDIGALLEVGLISKDEYENLDSMALIEELDLGDEDLEKLYKGLKRMFEE